VRFFFLPLSHFTLVHPPYASPLDFAVPHRNPPLCRLAYGRTLKEKDATALIDAGSSPYFFLVAAETPLRPLENGLTSFTAPQAPFLDQLARVPSTAVGALSTSRSSNRNLAPPPNSLFYNARTALSYLHSTFSASRTAVAPRFAMSSRFLLRSIDLFALARRRRPLLLCFCSTDASLAWRVASWRRSKLLLPPDEFEIPSFFPPSLLVFSTPPRARWKGMDSSGLHYQQQQQGYQQLYDPQPLASSSSFQQHQQPLQHSQMPSAYAQLANPSHSFTPQLVPDGFGPGRGAFGRPPFINLRLFAYVRSRTV